MRSLLLCALSLLLATANAQSSAANEATVEWTLQLPSNGGGGGGGSNSGLVKGNAVAEVNDELLAVTTVTGELHIVSKHNGGADDNASKNSNNNVTTFTPDPVSGLDVMNCTSGVVVVVGSNSSSDTTTTLLVYAVVDTDSNKRVPSSSRVLGVTTTGRLAWNVTVAGVIVGTPVYSFANKNLYIIHNAAVSNSGVEAGIVTVLQLSSGNDGSDAPTVATTLPSQSTGRPFGPAAAVVTTTTAEWKKKDFVFFADAGTDNRGALFVVTGSKNDKYDFTIASAVIGRSTSAPAVSAALEVYLGQESSTLIAWQDGEAAALLTGGSSSGGSPVYPTWGYPLQADPNNSIAREYILIMKLAFETLFLCLHCCCCRSFFFSHSELAGVVDQRYHAVCCFGGYANNVPPIRFRFERLDRNQWC